MEHVQKSPGSGACLGIGSMRGTAFAKGVHDPILIPRIEWACALLITHLLHHFPLAKPYVLIVLEPEAGWHQVQLKPVP